MEYLDNGHYKAFKLTSQNDKDEIIAVTKALDAASAAIKFELAGYNVVKSTSKKSFETTKVKKGKPIKVVSKLVIRNRNQWSCTNADFRKYKDLSVRYEKGVYHLI